MRAAPPAALRWDAPPPERIHGLSTATSLAVHRAEALAPDFDLYPGATDWALSRYREFLMPPGRRPRYPRPSLCPCPGVLDG
ncbi:hypothetical protein [Streptomyces lichenis]|uniref:Uncharacterized protein n=1 Tax=Streptomyces lichenis TaxID=2306967 RepID=A0ABT0IGM8_9ACTN|nr:hypothetical protein [Streptomyces lichenis]MCK8680485.1 hypothetical protein [Streptomyces lichenis]